MSNYQTQYRKNLINSIWDSIVKFFFYLESGSNFFSTYRNPIWTIMIAVGVFKIMDHSIVTALSLVMLCILEFAGWVYVNKMQKRMDYLRVEKASHFSRHSIKLQELTLRGINKISGVAVDEGFYEYDENGNKK